MGLGARGLLGTKRQVEISGAHWEGFQPEEAFYTAAAFSLQEPSDLGDAWFAWSWCPLLTASAWLQPRLWGLDGEAQPGTAQGVSTACLGAQS